MSQSPSMQKATGDRVCDDRTWCRGFTAALAALAPYGEDTIFDEVVESFGAPKVLIDQARKDRAMRWSGLSGYVRRRASQR